LEQFYSMKSKRSGKEAAEPRILAPKIMRALLPALDQPGLRAPTLSARVGMAILEELHRYRHEKGKLFQNALTVCHEPGVFFRAQSTACICFVPLSCISWLGEHVLDEASYSKTSWRARNDQANGTVCIPDLRRPCTDIGLCLELAAKLEELGAT
jgi:hypothetical protein